MKSNNVNNKSTNINNSTNNNNVPAINVTLPKPPSVTVQMLQLSKDKLHVCIPVINGQKVYPLMVGGTSKADLEDGMKFITLAVEAAKGDLPKTMRYIDTFQKMLYKGINITEKVTIGTYDFAVDVNSGIAYDEILRVVAALDETEKELPYSLDLLRTKIKAKLNLSEEMTEPNPAEIQCKSMSMPDWLIIANSTYQYGTLTKDDNIMALALGTDAKEIAENIAYLAHVFEIADQNPILANAELVMVAKLYADDIRPDDIISINGYRVAMDVANRKAYLVDNNRQIADLTDLGNVGLGKEAVTTLLTDRARLWLTEHGNNIND